MHNLATSNGMDEFDIPIFKKSYELYKTFYGYKNLIPKHELHALYHRCEIKILDIIEGIIYASQVGKSERLPALEHVSTSLSLLRVFVRLMKETKILDNKKYAELQAFIDNIGNQIGGWIRYLKQAKST